MISGFWRRKDGDCSIVCMENGSGYLHDHTVVDTSDVRIVL